MPDRARIDGDGPDTTLVDVVDAVRRTLSARTADRHLVEDLTQETLVKVAAARQRMEPSSLQAYAIVTARHLLANHARRQQVHRRHVHRLVEYARLEGPEHLALEREENDALAEALDRLDPADRALLLRHESDGDDLATLAADEGTSTGAMAMRLARTRAALRVDFVLALRHVVLPTAHCRAVLLALSSGDQRRQHALDATGHLRSCATCADLAHPIARRDRRIAAWLLVPIAEAVRRSVRAIRGHPAIATATAGAVAVAAVAAATVIVATRDDAPASATPTTATTVADVPVEAVRTPIATTTAPPSTTAAPTTTAPCSVPVDLDQLDPAVAGCPVADTVLSVTDVPADEGFWALTAAGREVWVQLVGDGESAVTVAVGATISVTGTTTAPDPATGAMRIEVGFDQLGAAG